jgi:putative isomerase
MHRPADTLSAAKEAGEVISYIERTFPACLNAPAGGLRHPFIDPGAGYRGILWDWDAYFCLRGLEPWADQVAEAARGCVLNFVDHQREDGSIPYALTQEAQPGQPGRPADSRANSAKPLIAQFAMMAARYVGQVGWLVDIYDALARHCGHWERTQLSRLGLFTLRSHRGSGSDDHPAVYCRPLNSSADVFINSLMVAEYLAMGAAARAVGRRSEATGWDEKAELLARRIASLMWDPIDGAYYNLDTGSAEVGRVNQEVTWVVPLKFRSWTMVMPLWAGAASGAHAERIAREHLLNPAELRSPHGVRSLARNEPAYEIAVGSNPSCWRGPVWIVANYLAWWGCRHYGLEPEADELAADVLRMLARDIRENGCLHEYYHPETGQGLTHPGFLNWNTLAALMARHLRGED